MNTKAIIGVSILAVILLVLGSQTNVVGYQTVQSSTKERLNDKDLLFQTICDIVNNQKIQGVTVGSHQNKFQNPFPESQLTSIPTITKKQLNFLYHLGEALSKITSKSKIKSMTNHYFSLALPKNKLVSVIKEDAVLAEEVHQLSALNCGCYYTTGDFEKLCDILLFVDDAILFLENPFISLYEKFQENGNRILAALVQLICVPFIIIGVAVFCLALIFDCLYVPPLPWNINNFVDTVH
jgi:hypothetical protein